LRSGQAAVRRGRAEVETKSGKGNSFRRQRGIRTLHLWGNVSGKKEGEKGDPQWREKE